jgi:SAM-dependent methyltransferase
MAKKDRRDDLLSLVPEKALRILDVGCASGDLGLKMKRAGREIIGIEYEQAQGNAAQAKLDKVIIGDAEGIALPYKPGYFDCILFADVLEHLRDPLALLKKFRLALADQGVVVASIPNIRYYKIISRLLFGGSWDYADAGILDRTHLRFFTLLNIRELFFDAGYEIVEIRRNIVASRCLKTLNFISAGFFNELLTYQYFVKLCKSTQTKENLPKHRVVQKI